MCPQERRSRGESLFFSFVIPFAQVVPFGRGHFCKDFFLGTYLNFVGQAWAEGSLVPLVESCPLSSVVHSPVHAPWASGGTKQNSSRPSNLWTELIPSGVSWTGRTVVGGGRLPRRHQNNAYRSGDFSATGAQWCYRFVALLRPGLRHDRGGLMVVVVEYDMIGKFSFTYAST